VGLSAANTEFVLVYLPSPARTFYFLFRFLVPLCQCDEKAVVQKGMLQHGIRASKTRQGMT